MTFDSDCIIKHDSGKRWHIESRDGRWTMQPDGEITAVEAKAICECVIDALTYVSANKRYAQVLRRVIATIRKHEAAGEDIPYWCIAIRRVMGDITSLELPVPDSARQVAEEMRERCANAVRGWRTRPNDCEALGFIDPETGVRECALEGRGRDCICDAQAEAVEEIERAIRALPLPGDKEG